MDQFKAALKASQWDKALACCSSKVQEAAKTYDSAQEFLLDAVPVDYVVAMKEYPVSTTRGKADAGYDLLGSWVDLMKSRTGPNIQWAWTLEKTHEGEWVVNFDPIPLRKYIARKALVQQERLELQRARFKAGFKAIKPSLERLKAKLVPLNEKYVVGKPVRFRLELANEGPVDLSYDDQQVTVNDPLIVTDAKGEKVKYIGGSVQAEGGNMPLRAGQTVVLFDKFDITRQYEINKPGVYRVQYKGAGLEIGDLPKIPPRNEAVIPTVEPDVAPYVASNVVEFRVQE
jgi:hypothetical protein